MLLTHPVDENSSHRLGCGDEEMAPALPPLDLLAIVQPEMHLVD
jgi:hypothetical protein